jgi:hypothetical protein
VIPEAFVGAWQRVSIALGGGPASESAQVLWVQGWSAYADIRVPHAAGFDAVECFAGHTTWEAPCLRWAHTIDLAGGPAALADVGTVEWDGDDLVERGTFLIDGTEVPYIEVWRRLPSAGGLVVEMCDDGFTHVQVGEHALTVLDERATGGSFGATYRRGDEVVLAIGDPVAVPSLAGGATST